MCRSCFWRQPMADPQLERCFPYCATQSFIRDILQRKSSCQTSVETLVRISMTGGLEEFDSLLMLLLFDLVLSKQKIHYVAISLLFWFQILLSVWQFLFLSLALSHYIWHPNAVLHNVNLQVLSDEELVSKKGLHVSNWLYFLPSCTPFHGLFL